MSLIDLLKTSSPNEPLYSNDVFSTWLYTGNGSTQTITNGIDLAGKGGMVWIKLRSGVQQHNIYDSARAWDTGGELITNTTDAAQDKSAGYFSTSSTGFGLPTDVYNTNAATYASWTFRKAAKFFDVVTWTNTSSTTVTVNHNLGVVPGMVIVKRTNLSDSWMVRHRSLPTSDSMMVLNSTAANSTGWTGYSATAATLTYDTYGNIGDTYVAYLFAHDTASDGIIQCGSFTTDASGNVPTTVLGWEPQYLLFKRINAASSWTIIDSMRGVPTGGSSIELMANGSYAESTGAGRVFSATGFSINGLGNPSDVWIYMAIRRPNKPPTSGTQVYQGTTYSGNTTTVTGTQLITTNLPVDLSIIQDRSNGNGTAFVDRLRGSMVRLQSAVTNADVANSGAYQMDYQNKFLLGDYNWNYTGRNYVLHAFKRAPGFFDVVCFTYSGSVQTVPHNLTVVPELMIVKNRTGAADGWNTYLANLGNTSSLELQSTAATRTGFGGWGSTTPTASNFYIQIGASGTTYVAYLFATLAGISKVGSYTGNGGTQNIDCGFAAGARFVLVKRTDAAGDWYVWDTARGIVAANDPHLSLNTTAAEVTTDDSIDPLNAGFTVNQVAATNINVSSATYIFLAVA